jgi:hypothetical protein
MDEVEMENEMLSKQVEVTMARITPRQILRKQHTGGRLKECEHQRQMIEECKCGKRYSIAGRSWSGTMAIEYDRFQCMAHGLPVNGLGLDMKNAEAARHCGKFYNSRLNMLIGSRQRGKRSMNDLFRSLAKCPQLVGLRA